MEIDLEQEKVNIIKKCITSDEKFEGHEEYLDCFFEETMKRGFIIFKSMDMSDPSKNVYLTKIISAAIDYVLEHVDEYKSAEIEQAEEIEQINDEITEEIPETEKESVEVTEQEENQTKEIAEESSKEIQEETSEENNEEISVEDTEEIEQKEPDNNISEDNDENVPAPSDVSEEKEAKEATDVKDKTSVKPDDTKEEKTNKYKDTKVNFDFDYVPVVSGRTIKKSTIHEIYDTVIIFSAQNPEKEYLQIYDLRYIQKMPINKIAERLNLPKNIVTQNLFELMEEINKNIE